MTGINFLGAELAAKRLGLLSWCPGLLALPYSSIRTRHGVPSRYCETWKLLLALTPSSRHQLSRLAPWPRHVRLELRDVVAKYPFEKSHRFPVIEPNSGRRDYSRSSYDDGSRSSGLVPGSQQHLARPLVNRLR